MEGNPALWFWVHPQWISVRALLCQPSSYVGHYQGPSVPQDSEILGYSRQSSSDRKTPLQAAHLTEQRPKSLIISSESFYLQRQCQEHRRQSSHLTLAGRCTGSPIHSKGNLSTAISTRRFTELKSSHFVPKERTETWCLRLDDNCNEIPKKM